MRSHPELEVTPLAAPPGAGCSGAVSTHPARLAQKAPLLGAERSWVPVAEERAKEGQGLQTESEGAGGSNRGQT